DRSRRLRPAERRRPLGGRQATDRRSARPQRARATRRTRARGGRTPSGRARADLRRSRHRGSAGRAAAAVRRSAPDESASRSRGPARAPSASSRRRGVPSARSATRSKRNPAAHAKILRTVSRHYVFDFDEPAEGGKELLGGKGAGLAELTGLEIPVPAGFTITTDACRDYSRAQERPARLEAETDHHLAAPEERTRKRYAAPRHPLPVSLPSGTAGAIPGVTATSSSAVRCARSSTPGTARARRSTAARITFRTILAPPSTSSRWSSATTAPALARASRSRGIRPPARRASTASSSRTRRAR